MTDRRVPPERFMEPLKRALKNGGAPASLVTAGSPLIDLLRRPEDPADLTRDEAAMKAHRRLLKAIAMLDDEQEQFLLTLLRLRSGTAIPLGQRYKQAGRALGISGNVARRARYRDTFLRALAMQLSEMLAKPIDDDGI
jgi:hypothetical protein